MRIPKYRQHSTRDCGFVEFKGRRHYLPGPYDSAESREAYKRFVLDNVGREPPADPAKALSGLSVSGLVLAFLEHARQHYGDAPRGEYANCRHALKPFADVHGPELAATFGPLRLKKWQKSRVTAGHARDYINQQISKIKRAFRWAASEELIPVATYQGLVTVQGLQAGRTAAPEPEKRQPVSDADVAPVLLELSPIVADMVRLQRLTGARSGSICQATPGQFAREGRLLLWRPRHKTEYLGAELVIPLGPKAQRLLRPYLQRCKPDEPLFSPRAQRANRRYGKRYKTSSYYLAVHRAIKRVNAKRPKARQIPEWFPHLLRHTRGQEVRERYGVEAAQSILGHDRIDSTEVYSGRRLELAKLVALETG